jgi:hypothetical protein
MPQGAYEPAKEGREHEKEEKKRITRRKRVSSLRIEEERTSKAGEIAKSIPYRGAGAAFVQQGLGLA